jgi:hypothetical protein
MRLASLKVLVASYLPRWFMRFAHFSCSIRIPSWRLFDGVSDWALSTDDLERIQIQAQRVDV